MEILVLRRLGRLYLRQLPAAAALPLFSPQEGQEPYTTTTALSLSKAIRVWQRTIAIALPIRLPNLTLCYNRP